MHPVNSPDERVAALPALPGLPVRDLNFRVSWLQAPTSRDSPIGLTRSREEREGKWRQETVLIAEVKASGAAFVIRLGPDPSGMTAVLVLDLLAASRLRVNPCSGDGDAGSDPRAASAELGPPPAAVLPGLDFSGFSGFRLQPPESCQSGSREAANREAREGPRRIHPLRFA